MRDRRLARAAALAAAGLIAVDGSRAEADLVVDLRAIALNGQPLAGPNAAKDVTVAAGDIVTFDLFARVNGTNGVTDELLKEVSGSLLSSGSLLGDLAGGVVAPFNAPPSQNGSVQDLDGDTDLDIGVTPNGGTPTTGYFHASASDFVSSGGTPIDVDTREFRIGQFTFTAVSGAGETLVNFARRADAGGGNNTTATFWAEDFTLKSPMTSPFTVAAPVHVVAVPEPAGGIAPRRRWR